MEHSPTVICILDGFGLNPNPEANAIALGKTPNFDRIFKECPATTLTTHGVRVGLPEGQMGNSEVGHLNIGAGRVVKQWLLKITEELESNILKRSQMFINFLKDSPSTTDFHLIGLFSDGGVHSHHKHLYKLIEELSSQTESQIFLHLITDGRDVSPYRSREQFEELLQFITDYPKAKIATVCGRYYAMDRDKRWDRIEKAFNAYTRGKCETATDILAYIDKCYKEDITDEFILPAAFTEINFKPEDKLLFWNFREDRMRQIVETYTSTSFDHFERSIDTHAKDNVLCFTDYDPAFALPVLFPHEHITKHLGEVISLEGLSQLRVAETEKYPHVTYFFNGGFEEPFENEERKLVPSPRDVPTYDHKPEMSAYPVRDIVVDAIKTNAYELIVVNFANCDMVGHTGVLEAAIKAVETTDECLGVILNALDQTNGQALIFADHGNAEQMLDYETGKPHTAHTTYPVPCIAYGNSSISSLRDDGALCDVAPTILQMMDLRQPEVMTGKSLIS